MEKLTEVISIKVTPEMAETIKALAKSEGTTVCDMGRELLSQKIHEARERYIASRTLDAIFSQDLK